jgi:hypothetical protein
VASRLSGATLYPVNPLHVGCSLAYAELQEQCVAIPEVAGLELLKLPQVFVIRYSSIRLLDLNDEKVIRSAPSMHDDVRHDHPTVGSFDVVAISVVLTVNIPSGKLSPKVISKPAGDRPLVHIADEEIDIGSQEIAQRSTN